MGSFAQKYGSGTSTSSSSISPLDLALLSRGISPQDIAQPPPQQPQGLLGHIKQFASNAISDVSGLGEDVLGLARVAANDVYGAGRELVGKDADFMSDELAKGLVFDWDSDDASISERIAPGIQAYLEESYGLNPVKGDILPSPGKVGSSLFNRPFSTVLDAYALTSGAGAAKAGIAKTALRGLGEEAVRAGRAPAWVRKTLPGIDPDSPLRDIEFFEGQRGLSEGKRGRARLGGVRRRMLSSEGGKLRLTYDALRTNPVQRKTRGFLHDATSRPVHGDAGRKGFLSQLLPALDEGPFPATVNEANRLYRQLDFADEHGIDRVDVEWRAKLRSRSEGAKRVAHWVADTYRMRNKDMGRLIDRFRELDLTPEQMEAAHQYFQGVRKVPTAARMSLDRMQEWVRDPARASLIPDEELPEVISTVDEMRGYIEDIRHADPVELKDRWGLADDADVEASRMDEIAAAEVYASHLSEYLSVMEKMNTPGEHIDKMAEAIAKVRWDWHRLTMDSIDSGYIKGFSDVMQRTFGPLHVEEMAAGKRMAMAGNRGLSDIVDADPNWYQRIRDDAPGFWRREAEKFDRKGWSAPLYYPHIDPRRARRSEFMLKQSQVLQRGTNKGPFKANTYWNYIQDTYEKNPLEAYARRAAHVRRIIETDKFVRDIIDTFGRPISHMDDYIPDTERIVNVDALKQMYRTRAELDEAVAEAITQGRLRGFDDAESLMGSILKDIEIKTPDEVAAALHGGGQLVAVPASVAKQLENYSKHQVGNMGRILWDSPMNAWRGAVLAYSPRWLVNNLLGNIVFLKMQGGKLTDVLRSAFDKKWQGAFDEVMTRIESADPRLRREAVQEGLFSDTQQYTRHLGGAVDSPVGWYMAETMRNRPLRTRTEKIPGLKKRTFKETMEHANATIEKHFRRASLMRSVDKVAMETGMKRQAGVFFRSHQNLQKIASEGLDEVTANRIVDDMNSFMNDYRKQTAFEKNIVRRYVFPFWSFYKHSAKLMLSYPITHPERAAVLRMFGEFAQEMDQDSETLPGYMQGAVPVGPGVGEGEERFLTLTGVNPFSGAMRTLEDPTGFAAMLGPQLKSAMEVATGKDMLTGRPFRSPEFAGAYGSDQQYPVIYDEAGNPVSVGDEATPVRPGIIEMLGRQFPQYDILRNIGTAAMGQPVGARYDTGETMMEGEQAKYPSSLATELLGYIGVPMTDFNRTKYQETQLANRRQALITALRQLGYLPQAEES